MELVFGKAGLLDDFLEQRPPQISGVHRHGGRTLSDRMLQEEMAAALMAGNKAPAFQGLQDLPRG